MIQPLSGKALILEDEKEKVSAGGIIIPDNARDGKFSTTARVIAVGPGKRQKGGYVEEPSIKAGDRIVLPKHHGTEVTFEGKVHRIIPTDVIDAVFEES